jgi:hypothetical protein
MRFTKKIGSEKGQTLVEFALIFPFLMVIVFLLLDFGIAIDRRVLVQHSVREGARQGAVALPIDMSGDDNDIKDAVVEQSQGIIDRGDVVVCFEDGPDTGTSVGDAGDNVRVSASFVYDFSPGSGGLLPVFGIDPASLSITMTPSSAARLESAVTGATAC